MMCVKAIRMVHFVVMAEMLMRICLEVLMKNKTHKKTVKTRKCLTAFLFLGFICCATRALTDRFTY